MCNPCFKRQGFFFVINNSTFVYMKEGIDRILINIPAKQKQEFARVCSDLGVSMTLILLASIDKFIKEAKTTK